MKNLKKCASVGCRNLARSSKNGKQGGRFCYKCLSRKYAARHPLRYSFNALRTRARQRGHEFKITLDWYIDFSLRTGYGDNKGKAAQSLSLDRINPKGGYTPGNIRVLTLSENSRRRYCPYFAQIAAAEKAYIDGGGK